MTKIYVVFGQYSTIDEQHEWNFRAFMDAERANECRNQLAAEVEKVNQNPPQQGCWQHPLDPKLTLWFGYSGITPEVNYYVDVVDLDVTVC
jgi:hypothetical protein